MHLLLLHHLQLEVTDFILLENFKLCIYLAWYWFAKMLVWVLCNSLGNTQTFWPMQFFPPAALFLEGSGVEN